MFRAAVFLLCALTCCAGANGYQIRPCAFNDYNCIADILADNSNCKKNVGGYVEKDVHVRKFNYDVPSFNSSCIEHDLIVHDWNRCHITDFFLDFETDTCLLTMDCPNMCLESTRVVFQQGSDRPVNSYKSLGTYALITVTVNLKHVGQMDLCNSFTFAEVTMPEYVLDPVDNPMAKLLSKDSSFLVIYERESFRHRAQNFIRHFVNNRLCDFGCPAVL